MDVRLTTADLPADMQHRPDTPAARAVKGSGLTITCRHGDRVCERCIVAAARSIVVAADARADA